MLDDYRGTLWRALLLLSRRYLQIIYIWRVYSFPILLIRLGVILAKEYLLTLMSATEQILFNLKFIYILGRILFR